jgi:hypothetical protein
MSAGQAATDLAALHVNLSEARRQVDEWNQVELKLPNNLRNRISGALLQQAIEHYDSMVLLFQKDLPGTAYALLRVLYETTTRGVWVLLAAKDREVKRFSDDKLDPRRAEVIAGIERAYGGSAGILRRLASSKEYRAMCGYTHGGYLAANRRLVGGHIQGQHAPGEMLEVLRVAHLLFAVAVLTVLEAAAADELVLRWQKTLGRPESPIADAVSNAKQLSQHSP